jgi:hypothetical protein
MAVYAKLDNDNKVVNIIIADSMSGSEYVLSPSNGTNAGKGGTYDPATQKFIKPKPFNSWTLNSNQQWEAPVAEPAITETVRSADWDEDNQRWYGFSFDGTLYHWNPNTSVWDAA